MGLYKIHVERVITRGYIVPKIPAFIKLWYRPNIDRQLKTRYITFPTKNATVNDVNRD